MGANDDVLTTNQIIRRVFNYVTQKLKVESVLTSSLGTYTALVSPYGYLRTTGEGSSIFYDDFDNGVDANQWLTSVTGTATVTAASSFLILTTGTTSGNTARAYSVPTFARGRWGFTQLGFAVKLGSGNVTNVTRFWGLGDLTDGIGFELVGNTLRAAVYASGVRIFDSTLTKPNDGMIHSYSIVTRIDQTYWFQDGFETPVASAQYFNPDNNTLPVAVYMTNTGTPNNAPTFQIMSVGAQSSDESNTSISDNIYPWLQAQVTSSRNLCVDGSRVNQPVRPSTGTLTDYSAAASTTSTQFVAANTNRKYLLIFNQSGSVNIAINFGSAAVMNGAGSIQLSPKSSFIMEGNFVTTQAVNIIAGSGTPNVTVKEGT